MLAGYTPEYIVLAKYMRILSPKFCRAVSRPDDQYSSFLFAGLYRREAVPSGA